MKDFIVASASPRRKEILSMGGFGFRIIPSDCDETIKEKLSPEETVKVLAERKALSVLEKNENSVVLGCDTVVALGDEILGKPSDREDAFKMIKALSGKTHRVCTGVCIADKDKTNTFVSVAEVEFYELSDETAESYVATGECDDKAGAYGIQGLGGTLVKSIKGDYYAIVGLPYAETVRVLSEFGIRGKISF
jgi:septum formation protein